MWATMKIYCVLNILNLLIKTTQNIGNEITDDILTIEQFKVFIELYDLDMEESSSFLCPTYEILCNENDILNTFFDKNVLGYIVGWN